jgi:hypothetical protein
VTEFADVAKARASYKVFREAMNAGREIMRRAGVADPPEVPDFDVVYRRMTPEARQELFEVLNQTETTAPADAIRLWQPFVRRAFMKA